MAASRPDKSARKINEKSISVSAESSSRSYLSHDVDFKQQKNSLCSDKRPIEMSNSEDTHNNKKLNSNSESMEYLVSTSTQHNGKINFPTTNGDVEVTGTTSSSASKNIPFTKKDEEIILQPFNYVLQVPGKMIREQLAQAFNYWMKIPQEKLLEISEIISILHNASLLIDDIEDNSVLRRGKPVAHSIFGIPSTINSANYVYFLGLQKTLALDHPSAVNVFCEQLLELHLGQGLDIYWRDSFSCPTEEEYKKMTIQKTGGLFGLAIRLMQLFSVSTMNVTKLTNVMGLYFQIRDDYANLSMKEYSDSKTYCEDLSEGKFSFPVVHAINTRPDCQQVINILRQRPKDVEVKKYCVSLLEKYGSLAYTIEAMKKLDLEARAEIERFGGNPILIKILDSLKTWVDEP